MKALLRSLIELSGYTPVSTKLTHDPQRQLPITREDFFNLYFAKVDPKTFFFVQIGANDGKSNDPINAYVTKYNLAGVAIEPQPDVFQELCDTYAGSRVSCVNSAIGEGKPMTFYSVKPEFYGNRRSLMTGIGSFDKANFLRSLVKKIPKGADPARYTRETVIEAPTFENFAQAKNIERMDFLQIDCEGYDWPILRTIDLDKWHPEIINFESMRLSVDDRRDAEDYLKTHGYRFFRDGIDTCAYRVRPESPSDPG